jgi:hypothetical protein
VIELLYVDHERLQSYAEQTGRRSRWVPSYSGTFGPSGPSVGATWTRQELSKVHEQLGAVRKYLARKELVDYQRPGAHEVPFREETLELQSVYIPPSGNHPLLKNGLTLWISDSPETGRNKPGLLVLIEQFPLPDEPSAKFLTGFTILGMLREEFGAVALRDEFNLVVPDEFKIVVVGGDFKVAVLRDEIVFPEDVLRELETFGARMGPPKTVAALYRMRATFMDAHRGSSLTTVGYPIAIWRA